MRFPARFGNIASFAFRVYPCCSPVGRRGGKPLRRWGLGVSIAACLLVGAAVPARETVSDSRRRSAGQLPPEAQAVHRLIRAGGPFAYPKDGTVFGNRERLLPARPRGFYREYTVPTPGARDRGARRIVCGGQSAQHPETCYYTADHYASFRTDRAVTAGTTDFFFDSRRNVTMLLQTVRPNIVQAIRAYRVEDLMQAAQTAGQHFLYANLTTAQSKQDVLEGIAEAFLFPAHFGKNLDALYDCMTDLVHKAGTQPGFVVVLEQLPDNPRFDREAREQLLDVFRDAADFWAERKIPFRCFYSFQ